VAKALLTNKTLTGEQVKEISFSALKLQHAG
jgi:hypothetical protein